MAELTNKLNITKNGTTYECTCYTTEEEGTPDNGSCWEIKNNGVTAYIGLWPKSITTGGHHSSLTAKKNNIEYWVETEVDQDFNLYYYARDNIENYNTIVNLSSDDISNLTLTGQKIRPDASYAFSDSQLLTSIPDTVTQSWNTSTVTNISYMFANCKALTAVDVSNWDVSHVTNMVGSFNGCEELLTLDLSNWNVSSATNMGAMFSNCKKLSINANDISSWDVSHVTNMANIFGYCAALTELNVSNWDVSNVTSMQNMFNGCTRLTTLDVSSWDTSKVENMECMFSWTKMSSIDVSDWDTSCVTDMSSMFRYCSKLTDVDVSNWDTSNVTDISCIFGDAIKLESINVSTWNTSNMTKLVGAFEDTKISSIDVSNWDTDKVINMQRLFYGCSNLLSVDVSQWDTSNLRNMESAFWGCSGLTSLNVSQWDTSNVVGAYRIFLGCSGLTSLDVSGWNTSKMKTMERIFAGCSNMEVLDISNWSSEACTDNMPYIFSCDNLQYLVIDSPTFKFQMKDPECGSLNTTCKILVPEALLDTYKAAENWSARADQFDAVENYTVTRSNGQVSVVPKSNGLRFKIGDATTADLMTIPAGVTAIRYWFEYQNGDITSVYRDRQVTPGKTYYFTGSMEAQQHYFSVYLIDASDDTNVGQVAMLPGPNEGNYIAPAYVIVEYLIQIGNTVNVGTMSGDQFTDFSITIPNDVNVVKLALTRAQVAAQGGVDCMNRESPYTIWGSTTANGTYDFYIGVTPNKTYNLRLNIHISNGAGSCAVFYSDSINAQIPDVTDY